MRLAWLCAAIACVALAAGCGKPSSSTPFKAIDVTARMGGELKLTDHTGKARTLADSAARWSW